MFRIVAALAVLFVAALSATPFAIFKIRDGAEVVPFVLLALIAIALLLTPSGRDKRR